MPVKQAETSSWRRVERVGEGEAGGCRVVVDVLDFIDIFEMRGWVVAAVETGGAEAWGWDRDREAPAGQS